MIWSITLVVTSPLSDRWPWPFHKTSGFQQLFLLYVLIVVLKRAAESNCFSNTFSDWQQLPLTITCETKITFWPTDFSLSQHILWRVLMSAHSAEQSNIWVSKLSYINHLKTTWWSRIHVTRTSGTLCMIKCTHVYLTYIYKAKTKIALGSYGLQSINKYSRTNECLFFSYSQQLLESLCVLFCTSFFMCFFPIIFLFSPSFVNFFALIH